MELATITPRADTTAATGPNGFNDLAADDFLQLLVTQLTNQDPLEPTSNEDLLQQLSSIRDIQLSTTLTDSLRSVVGSQRYGAAASLIGKSVSGSVGNEEAGVQQVGGIVTGVQFDRDGRVILSLDSGASLPLENVETVQEALHAAEALIGRLVRGVKRDGDEPRVVEGVVTHVRRGDERGDIQLELDTGETLAINELVASSELQ